MDQLRPGARAERLRLTEENTLSIQSAAPVAPLRKCSSHLGAHSMDAPRFLSALGGNHALRSKLLPDVGVIPLAVEFGVGQHQPNACFSRSHLDNRGQI